MDIKKFFTSEVGRQVIIQGLFFALISFLFNLQIEKVKPITAAETLKKENYLNSKKETYLEAINLLIREFAYIDMDMRGYSPVNLRPYQRYIGANPPSEFEINVCLAKLYIYSGNAEIPRIFLKCFNEMGFHLTVELTHFTSLVRKDLGESESLVNSAEYRYIVVPSDSMRQNDTILKNFLHPTSSK